MHHMEMTGSIVGSCNTVNSQCCPQCGSQMKEAERRKEGATIFVWFDCIKADCDGQWLQSDDQ
jgi:hypothetical protein